MGAAGEPQDTKNAVDPVPGAARPGGLKALLGHDVHPFVQFIKYGVAGGIATVVDIICFYLLAIFVFKALTPDDAVVKLFNLQVSDMSAATRQWNYVTDRTLTFLVSNLVAYVLNVLFVFRRGRHHWLKEVALFYLVSGIAFVVGTTLGSVLIRAFDMTTTMAFLANLVASLLINYACRKFIIFKG